MAFTYTYSGSFNVGLGSDLAKVLAAGVTGGFSYASAKTQLVSKSINLSKGHRGYMTSLPVLHYSKYIIPVLPNTVKSSLTLTFNYSGTTSQGIWGNKQCNEYTTNNDVASAQGWRSADGSEAIGTTVFVWTDCGTNVRLPMSQQDPAYQHPGVALPQTAYVKTFQTYSCTEDGCIDDSPSCCADGNCPVDSNVVGGSSKNSK